MDLAENLNTINGFSHLLITQCILSEFTIIVPLKSKQASEVTRAMLNSLFQQFNIKKIHTDNGPCFRSTIWLETMAALSIKVISSSALHPSGRGQVERLVGIIKLMLKRMLAIKSDLNWEYLPYLCAKILNNTVSPKTGFKPQEMVFGTQHSQESPLEMDKLLPIHPLVQNNKQTVEKLNSEIHTMITVATEKLLQLRLITNEKLNKNRVSKTFQINDYVFVLDRYTIPGNPRPLKTRFHPSPYIVIRPLWTTTLVKRLSDGFISLYANDDLKRYDGSSPLFANLPVEIKRVLLHDFQNLLESDLSVITKNDTLEIPTGLKLFDPAEQNLSQESNPVVDKNKFSFIDVQDELEPEQDKNLIPADDLTPATHQPTKNNDKIQDKNPAMGQQDIDLSRDNSAQNELAEDAEEEELMQRLRKLTDSEIDNDLRNLAEIGSINPTINVNNTNKSSPLMSDDSDSDSDTTGIHPPSLTDGLHLRSGRIVRFQ